MKFKRDVYYDLLNILEETNVIFLFGPRKCGKTVVLRQISEMPDTVYIDFKTLSTEKSMDAVNAIIRDIASGVSKTYLLDEMSYAFFAEEEIARIAEAYTEAMVKEIDVRTKIIFSGSQSVALTAWGRRAFCNESEFVKLDFLSYSEWLRYVGKEEVSAESYKDFVQDTSNFYKFTTIEEYFEGCLEETLVCNANSRNYVYGTDCDLVDVDIVVDIMYITFFALHDIPSATFFFQTENFLYRMVYLSNQLLKAAPFCSKEITERVAKSFIGRYDHVKTSDTETVKQCLAFLIRYGLLSATPVFMDMEQKNVNVLKQLEDSDGLYKTKSDLFRFVKFTINTPMFSMQILREILREDYSDNLNDIFLASVVASHVRGLLPSEGAFGYYDELGRKIDYVNRRNRMAVEIAIANEEAKSANLDLIPREEWYRKVLLTREISCENGDIKKIPYYEFIHGLSDGKKAQVCTVK